jgi:hypothetical protein
MKLSDVRVRGAFQKQALHVQSNQNQSHNSEQ